MFWELVDNNSTIFQKSNHMLTTSWRHFNNAFTTFWEHVWKYLTIILYFLRIIVRLLRDSETFPVRFALAGFCWNLKLAKRLRLRKGQLSAWWRSSILFSCYSLSPRTTFLHIFMIFGSIVTSSCHHTIIILSCHHIIYHHVIIPYHHITTSSFIEQKL